MASDPALIFDFADRYGQRRRLGFTKPAQVIVAQTLAEVRPALQAVQRAVGAGQYAAGYLAYDAAPAFDAAMRVQASPALPLLWFGVFDAPSESAAPPSAGTFRLSGWQPAIERASYERAIAAVRAAIGRGDTYQANYTMRLRADFAGDAWAFYQQLCAAQPADYCAYLDLGRFRILSASPELFFRWHAGRITAKPMKGTAPRGRWSAEDRAQAEWLAASQKNRAENLMIVDLLRNDIGRVARVGSVAVPRLFEIERYPTLFQMTSTITAETRPGTTLEDMFVALFPCGSITGAPKIATMQLLAAIEHAPRGVYCGAIGMVAPGGEAVFNVAIRTVLIDTDTGQAEYGVGGGITWDSTAADEYAEALLKAALLSEKRPAFELLETLRLEHGRYTLLDRHLGRLAESASYFGIPLDRQAARAALDAQANQWPAGARRVRLLVSQDGQARAESQPLSELGVATARVALARTPISRNDRFLFHKTTYRAVYEARRAEHPDLFDVLLWNEEGELTEFTIGNLVLELDGQRWTPPLSCGLLDGTLRAELLERGEIHERVLTRADLARASGCWLINSVRGWLEVEVALVA